MFKVGDKVKFIESSLASGMIDAKEDDVFTVKDSYNRVVTLEELQGCYHVTHFEHVQEEVMDNTEEQEIEWEVGQEVFCLLRGKGVVTKIRESGTYPIEVDFGETYDSYSSDGKLYVEHKNGCLFFSEPQIIAEKLPPKKPFVPVFEEGDKIIVVYRGDGWKNFITVMEEVKDRVFADDGHAYLKDSYRFYKLGEEIKFS